jgi:hypothetical protein
MKLFARIAALTVMAVTAGAFAQSEPPPPPPDSYGAAPSEAPPPPPSAVPAPPAVSSAPAQPVPPPPRTDGEWVYTAQYGYVWMPYGQSYTYVYGDHASMYVFYPHYGWRWVAAPWVLGVGPLPRWGVYGPRRFAWYAHPWFRGRIVYGRRYPRVYRRRW